VALVVAGAVAAAGTAAANVVVSVPLGTNILRIEADGRGPNVFAVSHSQDEVIVSSPAGSPLISVALGTLCVPGFTGGNSSDLRRSAGSRR
jgi:hypothetical protein